MNENKLPFLGRGWSFPPQFSANGKELVVTDGVENVHKSIELLLHTDLGERVLNEDFGGALRRYLFEPMNSQLLNNIKDWIENALVNHESRVILDQVTVSENKVVKGMLMIQLQYTVRSTNTRFNMVYPFHLNETTLIS